MRYLLSSEVQNGFYKSDESSPTLYFSFLNAFAADLKAKGKGVVYFGDNFITGLLGEPKPELFEALKAFAGEKAKAKSTNSVSFKNKEVKKSKPVKTSDIMSFQVIGDKDQKFDIEKLCAVLEEHGIDGSLGA